MIYISGPMSSIGPPSWNYPAFMETAMILRANGWDVLNPAELHPADPDVPWSTYLRADLKELLNCHSLLLLPGWEHSRGARLEYVVAHSLEFDIFYPHELDNLLVKGIR